MRKVLEPKKKFTKDIKNKLIFWLVILLTVDVYILIY